MKAPENAALFHGLEMRIYDSKNDSTGKLTRVPSLSRDCRVVHLPQDDLRKPLPPRRAIQRININTRHFNDEQRFTIVPHKLQHHQGPHERT